MFRTWRILARTGTTRRLSLAASAGRRQFLVRFAGILLASFAPSAARAQISAYKLGANDRLRITVFGEDRLSGEFVVDGQGALAYPLIGAIDVRGKTADEVAAIVRDGLRGRFILDPRVSAEIVAHRAFYILGEVAQPGEYATLDGLTLLRAIATAKGFTPRANRRTVTIKSRADGKTRKIAVKSDPLITPDDVIIVHERFF